MLACGNCLCQHSCWYTFCPFKLYPWKTQILIFRHHIWDRTVTYCLVYQPGCWTLNQIKTESFEDNILCIDYRAISTQLSCCFFWRFWLVHMIDSGFYSLKSLLCILDKEIVGSDMWKFSNSCAASSFFKIMHL